MPLKQMEVREQRVEFVVRALSGREPLSQLCQEFGISRPTGYLWLVRYRDGGVAAIEERSRRPLRSPTQTAPDVEARIVALRKVYPDWGARKLASAAWPPRHRAAAEHCASRLVASRAGARPGPSSPRRQALRARRAQRTLADGLQGAEELAEGGDGAVGARRSQSLSGGA